MTKSLAGTRAQIDPKKKRGTWVRRLVAATDNALNLEFDFSCGRWQIFACFAGG